MNGANVVRDFTADPANDSTFGTVDIRRTFKNETGVDITRLRFRIVALSTFPVPSGIADLRARTSTAVVVNRGVAGGATENVTVHGTTLEQPPSQTHGGGLDSTLSVSSVNIANPLAPGATIDLRFLFGVENAGKYQLFVEVEALPNATRSIWGMIGETEKSAQNIDCALTASSTQLTSSATKILQGEAVTFTATSAWGNDPAVGDVKFMADGVELGIATLVAGKAQLATGSLALGPHTITAKYLGASSIASSRSAPVVVEVEPAAIPPSGADSASTGGADVTPGGDAPTASEGTGDARPSESSAPGVEGGCNASGRADASSISILGLMLAAVIIAARRRRG
jgi:hypothetical protein